MNNLTTNQPASDDIKAAKKTKDSATGSKQSTEVPLRRGSKYSDILLQRLKPELFSQNSSAVIGVASFGPRQGVTTTALNLGIRAADHGISPTLVIDANFRNQKVSRVYRTGNQGLSECLSGRSTLGKCVRNTKVDNLSVLGVGQVKIARQLVMATQPTIDFIDELRDSYRLSILDLPSIHEPSLADVFLPHLDGVLIVAQYGARKEKLEELHQYVQDSGGKILGSVMTGNESKLPRWLSRFF